MDVMPWRAKSTTTVALWRPILSHGVFASSEGGVAMDGMFNDRIKISRCRGDILRGPRFMLVFWNVRRGQAAAAAVVVFVGRGSSDASAATHAIGYQDTHVVSTFRYTADTQTVSFWLRMDVVDVMFDEPGEWTVYIRRTESWEKIGDGLPITARLNMGESWANTASVEWQ